MDARPIIAEHEVVFQPKGALESLDYTNAINALNSGTELALGVLGKDGRRFDSFSRCQTTQKMKATHRGWSFLFIVVWK